MTNSNSLKSLWASDAYIFTPMTPEALRYHSKKFRGKIARRNAWEYAAGTVVIAFFAAFCLLIPLTLARWGAGLIIIGTLYIMWCLHNKAHASAKTDLRMTSSVMSYHKHQLGQQRDALRSIWSWYILPLVPGTVVFLIGTSMEFTQGASMLSVFKSIFPQIIFIAFVFCSVAWINQRAAKRINQEIRAIDPGIE
jgi:glucan phosphoethanolaminetransferase (alkaline phosphatase superfamily)